MALLELKEVTLALGDPPLIDAVDLRVDPRERVCLLGRNGEGKTTLLRLISGELQPDDGAVRKRASLRIGVLPQALPSQLGGTVHDHVATGLGELGTVVTELLARRAAGDTEASHALETRINSLEGWDAERRILQQVEAVGLEPATPVSSLSGGQLRRMLIARALVSDPELLILDEPTNHLDLPSIEWLERLISSFGGSVIFTTHDRAFLQALATRIVELERGALTSWPGDYANYLRRRAERDAAEEKASAQFFRRLKEEEKWIRQGIMARRTRNEGRVRRLQQMRIDRGQRRERQADARFGVQEAEKSSRRVIEAENLTFAYPSEAPVVRGLDTIIQRGDKVGIIGPNGSGKTTLIRLLLGELEPDEGTVVHGTRLEVAYFDQRRSQLDDESTVLDNVADGADTISVDGTPRHVISYLQDFLFTPERARGPVSALSGGERNRMLMAKLFARPSNLLLLDEPTNDLDVETLELLEEKLTEYTGTIILVSHDRAFLDNVVTSTLVFEGGGRVVEYAGGYSDWLTQRPAPKAAARPGKGAERRRGKDGAGEAAPAAKKLSYKEQRELESFPARIEALEQEIQALQAALSSPELYQRSPELVAERAAALKAAEATLELSYERWGRLDALGTG